MRYSTEHVAQNAERNMGNTERRPTVGEIFESGEERAAQAARETLVRFLSHGPVAETLAAQGYRIRRQTESGEVRLACDQAEL